ncbi:hypothetical protein [Nocardioides sp. GXQ0305]|uniref:hypothetical protein n=1 Tax=Nocardioides sp. GXQ0305 TaxID=3423912 RepID=UPI003D7C82CE
MSSGSSFTLSRSWRRAVLALHVLCGVGWMGLDLGLLVLVLAGLTSGSGATVAASYTAVRLVIPVVVPVLAVAMLGTGVLLGLGTRWRLTEWTWVLTKLVIGLVLTTLVFVALLPGALGLPTELAGTAAEVREAVGRGGQDLLYPPVVSFTALAVALVLSIWRPWGRTRWARRRSDLGRPAGQVGPGSPSGAGPSAPEPAASRRSPTR